ncbi:CBS domain containing-hemolysin-like protein [Pontibacter aydingkolensis]|uniref:CNNM domain-containing protein n=1 Tax=Pontibacter aydingkolensis TaxID=1911536 RepID=A0ABS7CYX8_9BACT|nr:CNNM domain-containing protein [Pontibacter aydingkolensis]MBW7468717.1 CNNM domain-containing protein [Pontibacter aydingkolensis]
MGLLILYLAIALIFSFLCSLLEASLLSITPSHANIISKESPSLGKDLQNFKDNIDRPLAAILTLNTFAHTIGAAGVGAQAQILWGDDALTIVSVVLTIVILIFTEIIPKTLGANYWKALTPFTVRTLKILIYSPLYPIILFSQFITKRLKQDKNKSVLSRADFTAMAEIGTKEGVLHKDESRVINNVLRFNAILTSHIMTPRTVIKAAPEKQYIREFYDNSTNMRFSRIPVFDDSIDHITGYVLKDEILHRIIEEQGGLSLAEIKRPIQVVHMGTPVPKLFTRLMDTKEHIALVVDEYGGTAGLVTMEDIIETLLGLEITDEFDAVEDLQKWARERWEKRAERLGFQGRDDAPPKV